MPYTAALDRKAWLYLGAGTQPADILFAASESTALMSAEGTDSFPGKVIALQKGEYHHRHSAPIVGIAQIDGFIFTK